MAVELVCFSCAVQQECLESALMEEQHDTKMRFGVRGGKTAHERELLWIELLARRAGWCPKGKHIVEYDEECAQCRVSARRSA